MKERAIISIILLLLAYTVCGCEEEPVEFTDCNFVISEPNDTWSIKIDNSLDYLQIIDSNIVLTKPNEASYKAWFGW